MNKENYARIGRYWFEKVTGKKICQEVDLCPGGPDELVSCHRCMSVNPRKECIGVGEHDAWEWTCGECVYKYGFTEAIKPVDMTA